MRLEEKEISIIKSIFKDIFGSGEIYLFGSRIDDNKKGGDIDLYLVTNYDFNKELEFRILLQEKLGEQKIDIVFSKDKNRDIEKVALQGIKL
jgi:predicted nucleotidyltransferase